MPTAIPSPRLFPGFVAQHTVLLDERDPRSPEAQFPGVVFPAGFDTLMRKRQLEFAAGRHCAREALRRCSPELADLEIPRGPSREPLWPAGIVGSITHAHGYASVAVARRQDALGVGLDAERWVTDRVASEIVDAIAARSEVHRVALRTGLSSSQALTLIFSAKETSFKCFFPTVKRYVDFRDASIVTADPSKGAFELQLLSTLAPALRVGDRFGGRFECDAELVRTAMVLFP